MPGFNFTPDLLADLKLAYAKALAAGVDSFVWQGHGLLVSYAKHLIEYLEGEFK